MNAREDLMKCSDEACRKTRMEIFKKNDIDELKKQAELCEMCNNVAQTKNTSNTFNSVSLRYKKLQLDYKKKVFVVG